MNKQGNFIASGLWNEEITKDRYSSPGKYEDHLLEQYKLYVEMADRVSGRRNLANTFFLTLHTLILAGIAFLYDKGLGLTHHWVIVLLLSAILTLCYAWWRIVKSYRQLNTAKFKVIGEFEKRLPASPYWSAEWKALGEGRSPKLYLPLTHIEEFVPIVFAILYIVAALIMMLA